MKRKLFWRIPFLLAVFPDTVKWQYTRARKGLDTRRRPDYLPLGSADRPTDRARCLLPTLEYACLDSVAVDCLWICLSVIQARCRSPWLNIHMVRFRISEDRFPGSDRPSTPRYRVDRSRQHHEEDCTCESRDETDDSVGSRRPWRAHGWRLVDVERVPFLGRQSRTSPMRKADCLAMK